MTVSVYVFVCMFVCVCVHICLSVGGTQLSSRRRRDDSSAGGGGQSTSESEAESDFEQMVGTCSLASYQLHCLVSRVYSHCIL